MYSMSISGILFRLQNDHNDMTIMVPNDQKFPFRVIQKIVQPDLVFDPEIYYKEEVFMDITIPDDTVELFRDRIKDVKRVIIYYHDKRYEIDALSVEHRYQCTGREIEGLYIIPDTMSKYLVQ